MMKIFMHAEEITLDSVFTTHFYPPIISASNLVAEIWPIVQTTQTLSALGMIQGVAHLTSLSAMIMSAAFLVIWFVMDSLTAAMAVMRIKHTASVVH